MTYQKIEKKKWFRTSKIGICDQSVILFERLEAQFSTVNIASYLCIYRYRNISCICDYILVTY